MSLPEERTVEQLISAYRSGDQSARNELIERLYIELRKISSVLLRGEGGISLTVGDLVNEAIMRIIQIDQFEPNDKAHFLALSARTMRRVLVDHARKHRSNKRQHQKVTLVTHLIGIKGAVDIQHLEKALIRLKVLSPDKAKIIEMRYYGGLTIEDIAIVMEKSPSTIKREWRVSRAWLLEALEEQKKEIV